jgi:4-hydroxyphenylacetate 3-monooxygenase
MLCRHTSAGDDGHAIHQASTAQLRSSECGSEATGSQDCAWGDGRTKACRAGLPGAGKPTDNGGVVTRVGDETVGEMWSLADGKRVLNEIDPRFSENIERHIAAAYAADPFHVSANTDPKGDRSKRPQDQDPDFLVHVVKETDAGIVIRGAKYETAAAYSNQAFLKPTIANWGDAKLSDYAVGCILRMAAPGVKHICRSGFAGRNDPRDYPLSNRCDEIDTLVILDDVLIPWEDVLFYRHTGAASFIRATLHRYSAFPYVQRTLTMADLMIGVALWNARQTGLDKQQAVQEKLAELAVWREGINAHLTAAIAMAEPSENGFLMPNQSLLFTGRYYALSNLPRMMHLARELCGGQICVTPNVYRAIGAHLKGVFPVSTGLVISALARPEWVVEVDATAVIPD